MSSTIAQFAAFRTQSRAEQSPNKTHSLMGLQRELRVPGSQFAVLEFIEQNSKKKKEETAERVLAICKVSLTS